MEYFEIMTREGDSLCWSEEELNQLRAERKEREERNNIFNDDELPF